MDIKFGERLKELRIDKGLSQLFIGEILGCSQRKISWLESGKVEPSLPDLWKISDYFNVSCDFLIGKVDY